MKITYIGHATLLIEIAGVRILTDPNFDLALGRFLPRVHAPGVALDRLPALDALLVTHAHADHLSLDSLARLPRDIPLYAPPTVARWLAKLGYGNAVAIPSGGEARVGEVTVRAAAARHVGSRYGIDRWRADANMYLLDAGATTSFFAGDTALTPSSHHLVEEQVAGTGRRLDVALLPIGHGPWWKPRFRAGHLTSDDALTLFERLDARYFIPYHWGVFQHVTSGPFDAIERLRALIGAHRRGSDVRILEPGSTFDLIRAGGDGALTAEAPAAEAPVPPRRAADERA